MGVGTHIKGEIAVFIKDSTDISLDLWFIVFYILIGCKHSYI